MRENKEKVTMSDDVQKIWEDFWKEICTKDGVLDIEQVKKELADFYYVMDQVPKVYSAVTGGTLSKIMYDAKSVISMFQDYFISKECVKDDIVEILKGNEVAEEVINDVIDILE